MSRSGATVAVVTVEPDADEPAGLTPSVRRPLSAALRVAAKETGVPVERLHPADRPDGLSLVVDGNVPAERVAGRLLTEWNDALVATAPTVRCRIAVHRGLVGVTGAGWGGDAFETAERLARTRSLRDALKAARRARIALIVSDEFHRDVVTPGPRGLDPSTFARVVTADGDAAWIRVLGYAWPPTVADSDVPTKPDETRHRDSGDAMQSGNTFSGTFSAGRDVITGDKITSNVYYGHRLSGDE